MHGFKVCPNCRQMTAPEAATCFVCGHVFGLQVRIRPNGKVLYRLVKEVRRLARRESR